MTKPLSPAAQAVLHATWRELDYAPDLHLRWAAAAALEAAADQVVPDEPNPGESQFWDDEADQEWQNNQHFCKQLLAIAAELKAQ